MSLIHDRTLNLDAVDELLYNAEAHGRAAHDAAMEAVQDSAEYRWLLDALERLTRERVVDEPQEALVASLSDRGRQPNLSYFAFTATPVNIQPFRHC